MRSPLHPLRSSCDVPWDVFFQMRHALLSVTSVRRVGSWAKEANNFAGFKEAFTEFALFPRSR